MAPRVGTAAERGRSLVGGMATGVAWGRSHVERLRTAFREWDQFDLVFASICVGLGLTVGILVPLVLTR